MDKRINYRRWFDVVALGVVSYALVMLIAGFSSTQKMFEAWSDCFSLLPLTARVVLTIAGVVLSVYVLHYFNVLHKGQLKRLSLLIYYPPIIISIFLALGLFAFHLDLTVFFSGSFLTNYLSMSGAFLSVLLGALCVWDRSCRENVQRSELPEINVEPPKWITDEIQKKHYRWLMSEHPVANDDGMFDRSSYVSRIEKLFKTENRAKHIAIVGPFGIGKTSLWRSVENELGNEFIFVPVDGWGRSDNTAAAQIIDEMVSGLTAYVDCASIRSIPKDYAESLAGADFQGASFLGKILPLHSHQSPEKLMWKIDSILHAIGKTMVVVLEDFDRNPNAENSINEISGLLDRLRDLKTINFIVCLAPGVQSHVLSRVSTHREDLLSFDADATINVTIDLMKAYAHQNDKFCLSDYSEHKSNFIRAINSVIKTPRDAKYALRRAFVAWESLAGEVNMYELMAVNALRYSAPQAFDFMIENFDILKKESVVDVDGYVKELKRKSSASNSPEGNFESSQKNVLDQITGFSEVFIKLIDLLAASGVQERYARGLLKMLFPYWHSISGVRGGNNAQHIVGRQGKVYLNRILSERISEEHESQLDVEFFKHFYKDRKVGRNQFLGKIHSSKYLTEKFINFVSSGYPQIEGVGESIFDQFVCLLALRCSVDEDIFFEDIYPQEPERVVLIIERLRVKGVDKTVLDDVLILISANPEKLFSTIKFTKERRDREARYGGSSRSSQCDFFRKNKVKLNEFFSKSPQLSSERKNEILQFLIDQLDS